MAKDDTIAVHTTTIRLVEATLRKLKTYAKTARYADPYECVWDADDDITLRIVRELTEDGNAKRG